MRAASLLLLGLALLAPAPAQEWKRVEPGLALSFPADHGAHPDYRTEWWYLTGNLATPAGRRFGFQLTFFRTGLDASAPAPGASPLRARQVYAAHFAISDVEGGRTLHAERLRRAGTPLARASRGDLDVALDGWTLRRTEDDRLVLAAADPAQGFALALELVPRKPLVLHGAAGYSAKGGDPGNASAYASWTRLAARGQVTLEGAELAVDGAAWYDHEFATSALAEDVVGWDWYGLQLDDGRELMLFDLRRADGTKAPASAGTLVERDGTARALAGSDFAVAALGEWTSPHTGATYPAGWRVELPGEGLAFTLTPLVDDAEIASAASTRVTYWEGPVELRGAGAAPDLHGYGYAELTGYAESMQGRF